MNMRQKWILTGILCAIVLAGASFALHAAPGFGICRQIRSACLDAGFVRGGAPVGYGVKRDCIDPILQGRAESDSGLPLPWVDPRVVAACRTGGPGFAQPQSAQRGPRAIQGSAAVAPPNAAATSPPQNPPLNGATAQSAPPPAAAGQPAPVAPGSSSSKRPNIVYVLTDDFSTDLVQYMPHVLKMQKDGVTFSNFYVTDSLCCPSRASIFTGRYPHDTGIFKNKGREGGYQAFHERNLEQTTFATALSAAGYRTAMLGKYLNMYEPEDPVPPGWKFWAVAGNAYREFNYRLNQNGSVTDYGNKPTDYLTDVVSGLAVDFIKRSAGAPFMIEVATFAPHRPSTPAPRDANALPGLRAPRSPAFNAAPDADAVGWVRALPQLSDADIADIDSEYRLRAQSVLAVDKMIGELQAAVAAIGQEDNTYFVFNSDNGYHMGEHRLLAGKMTAYDMDIHVPLVFTGPGIAAGRTIDEVTQNIDLCPTFAELAGAAPVASVDGRSFAPLLQGQQVAGWRTVALVEHHGPVRRDPADPDTMDLIPDRNAGGRIAGRWRYSLRNGNPTTYEAIRGPTWMYAEYATGEKEYHDLATDPNELRNTFPSLSAAEKASLHATIQAIANCHDATNCQAAERPIRSAAQK
jgi:N-acetylglucosamine-6-sulfatase